MQQRVSHIIWGEGYIEYRDARYVRVVFDNGEIGTRTFVWPDAFGRFLRYEDAALQTSAEALLRESEQRRADEIAEAKAAEARRAEAARARESAAKEDRSLKRKRALAYAHARNKKLMH